ncbi:MAG: BrnT family toxin [Patescibacteria group bacterium]
MRVFRERIEFEWDKGNIDKNLIAHGVKNEECEEVFFDPNKRVLRDLIHSDQEKRYIIIGETKKQRVLFIVFAVRKMKVRIISARDLNKKELHLYHEKKA